MAANGGLVQGTYPLLPLPKAAYSGADYDSGYIMLRLLSRKRLRTAPRLGTAIGSSAASGRCRVRLQSA